MQCDDDIGEVADDDHDQVDITIHTAEVVAMISLESYAACVARKSFAKLKNSLTSWGALPSAKQCSAYRNVHNN